MPHYEAFGLDVVYHVRKRTVTAEYPSLTHALVEALVDLAWFIESMDDE
ncbi:hypothetical protein [Kitasatospora atroaurantiaca]|nr:hypothetical protein [Kitasatospora atroaurantiaca]